MEISPISGLSQLGIEGSEILQQWQVSPSEELNMLPLSPTSQLGQNLQHQHCNNNISFGNWNNQFGNLRPKQESFPSDVFVQNSLLSFGHHNARRVASRGVSQARDHIIAERKRREKLSQRFIALSTMVPGLKKTDKASVLGDAIKYLKHLQERVKILEEQTRKKTMESVIYVKKSQLFSRENHLSDNGTLELPLPEIEVRFCDRSVLIRIHCEKRKGVLEKTQSEIEKLHLTVTSSSVMTFGTSVLDFTILAQMDLEFNMNAKDVVKNLKSALEIHMKGNLI